MRVLGREGRKKEWGDEGEEGSLSNRSVGMTTGVVAAGEMRWSGRVHRRRESGSCRIQAQTSIQRD